MSYHTVNVDTLIRKYNDNFLIFALACKLGNLDIIKCIDKNDIDVNIEDGLLFYIICENGHIDVLKYVIEEFNCDYLYKYTSIMVEIALINKHIDIVKYLLETRKNIYNIIFYLKTKDIIFNKIKFIDDSTINIFNYVIIDYLFNNDKELEIFECFTQYINENNNNFMQSIFDYCFSRGYYNMVMFLLDKYEGVSFIKNLRNYYFDALVQDYNKIKYEPSLVGYMNIIYYIIDNYTNEIKLDNLYQIYNKYNDNKDVIELKKYIIKKYNI